MVSICEAYAAEYHLLFNPSKSKLMYFNLSYENFSVELCGKEVLLVLHETYLGNFIGSDMFDRAITQSVCAFNQSSNHLIADGSNYDSLFARTVAYPVQVAYWNQRGHSPLRIQCPMSNLTSGPETWPWGPVGW